MQISTTLAILTLLSATAAHAATTCKTMSLNVRTSNAADPGNGSWEVRKSHMQDMIVKFQPDFVGTQEASPSQYEFLKSIDGYGAIGECAGTCKGNERTFIMYNEEDWELLENGDFALSDDTEQLGSNTWGLVYNREATWGRFRHRANDNTVCVFNTHYDMSKGHPKSSVLVASKMAALCKDGDLATLTGDFNTEMPSSAMQYLLGKTQLEGKTNSFPLVSALDEVGATGGTFIGNGNFQTGISSTRFDFVFAKAENLCIQKGEVIDDRFDGKNAISDHAQVMATFCVGDDCTGCNGGSRSYNFNDQTQDEPATETPTDPMKVETPVVTTAPTTAAPATTDTPTPAVTTPAPMTTEPTTTETPVVTPSPSNPADAYVAATVAPTIPSTASPKESTTKRPDCAAQR